MERKLDDLLERIVRLETAEHFRHQYLAGQIANLEMRLMAPDRSQRSGAWLKIPLALSLPAIVFLVMLGLTGDLRTALSAARWAG